MRVGRAQGEIRQALVGGLEAGRGTTRELALRTGVGVTAAMRTLDNMRRAGDICVVETARVPGVRRPVPVYDLARREDAAPPGYDWSLVTCWAQFPASA